MNNYDNPLLSIPVFKFALSNDNSIYMPTKGTNKATGWDVRAALSEPLTLRAGQYAKIPIGFRVFAPDGWWLEIRPHSSSFTKKQLHCLYGVIDEDYEGECVFACQYIPDIKALGNDLIVQPGDAIGQLIPIKRQEMKVETINNEEYKALCKERNFTRGVGGFGSTG